MAFFSSAITTLKTLVVAIGAGLGVWGVVNLLEGYGNDLSLIHISSTQKGQTKVSRFPLVVKRNRTSKAFGVMITAYGNNAEFVEKYLEKGIKIALSGELVISQITEMCIRDRHILYTILQFSISIVFCQKSLEIGRAHV